jgi:hypothetical protein
MMPVGDGGAAVPIGLRSLIPEREANDHKGSDEKNQPPLRLQRF